MLWLLVFLLRVRFMSDGVSSIVGLVTRRDSNGLLVVFMTALHGGIELALCRSCLLRLD